MSGGYRRAKQITVRTLRQRSNRIPSCLDPSSSLEGGRGRIFVAKGEGKAKDKEGAREGRVSAPYCASPTLQDGVTHLKDEHFRCWRAEGAK